MKPVPHAEAVALSVGPDSPAARWVGVRHDGRLIGCAARLEPVPGIPLLASVAVHPDGRRAGLGAALTGAIIRHAVAAGAPRSRSTWTRTTTSRAALTPGSVSGPRGFSSWSLPHR